MADEGQKLGIAAAVDQVVDTSAPPAAEPEQSALPLDAPAADPARPDNRPVPLPKRGPGRPPGAKNRRSQEWAEFLLKRGRSPLMALQDTYLMPVEDLARRLGCDKLEAYRIQMAAAEKVAPFIHEKMPIAVNVDEHKVVRLVLADGGDFAGGGMADDELAITAIAGEYETVADQAVSEAENGELDSEELDKP